MQKRRFPAIPRLVRSVLLVLILGAVGRVQAADTTVPWTLRADWSGGYSGWMSFPLAQDIGFDPSIYTEKRGTSTALIHNFLSHGESQAWFGLIRPATFLAGPAAHIELQYRLEIAGARSEFELILVGGNGHKYFAALPSGDGEHEVQITGAELGLSTLTPMKAIVLRGRLHDPPAGSESHWTLEQFVLHGARTPEVALSLPHLAPSVDGAWVAHEIVSAGDRMEIELGLSRASGSSQAVQSGRQRDRSPGDRIRA